MSRNTHLELFRPEGRAGSIGVRIAPVEAICTINIQTQPDRLWVNISFNLAIYKSKSGISLYPSSKRTPRLLLLLLLIHSTVKYFLTNVEAVLEITVEACDGEIARFEAPHVLRVLLHYVDTPALERESSSVADYSILMYRLRLRQKYNLVWKQQVIIQLTSFSSTEKFDNFVYTLQP